MGVARGFWEVLRPVARMETLDFLRGKVLAIDLSYWMCQLLTAVKGVPLLKPHIRLLFFRSIHLVAKTGAIPVFITDGEPPALKRQVRLERFSRISGLTFDSSAGVDCSTARNSLFTENIQECVELLELLGLPVLRAKHEAEALCADLNRQGLVHACVTPDSDAFLHGAKWVIKTLQADPRDPHVELYRVEDIESTLGLHQEHLIALALLVGCDYDIQGVQGIGCQSAVRLIKTIEKHQILDRLRAWGAGNLEGQTKLIYNVGDNRGGEQNEGAKGSTYTQKKEPHCSYCGHPGTKKLHWKVCCEECMMNGSIVEGSRCRPKSRNFRCSCESCRKADQYKKQTKQEGWKLKVYQKIAKTEGFPNEEIIQIFMSSKHDCSTDPLNGLKQKHPQLDALEKFLADQLKWDKLYVRRKILPLLSFYCLMDLAGKSVFSTSGLVKSRGLINGLYSPHSIQRVKISFSKPFYRLRWKPAMLGIDQEDWLGLKAPSFAQEAKMDDEIQELQTETIGSNLLFTTDEDITLVTEACPDLVHEFEQEQEARQKNKKRKNKANGVSSMEGQLSIKTFFKSKKQVECSKIRNEQHAIIETDGEIFRHQPVEGLEISAESIVTSKKSQVKAATATEVIVIEDNTIVAPLGRECSADVIRTNHRMTKEIRIKDGDVPENTSLYPSKIKSFGLCHESKAFQVKAASATEVTVIEDDFIVAPLERECSADEIRTSNCTTKEISITDGDVPENASLYPSNVRSFGLCQENPSTHLRSPMKEQMPECEIGGSHSDCTPPSSSKHWSSKQVELPLQKDEKLLQASARRSLFM